METLFGWLPKPVRVPLAVAVLAIAGLWAFESHYVAVAEDTAKKTTEAVVNKAVIDSVKQASKEAVDEAMKDKIDEVAQKAAEAAVQKYAETQKTQAAKKTKKVGP